MASFLLLLLGCPRSDTRAVISGRVQLANLAGANDLTRVRVDIGRGEGGATLDGDGNFEFADLEPDVYDLTITYSGGLDASSTGSAYQPYAIKVAARAGGSASLGVIPLMLGVGTVRGTFTRTDQGGLAGLSVRLLGNGPPLEEVSTNGSFVFPEVPVGRYQLFAARPGSAGVCGQMVVVGFHGAEVTVPTQMLQNATPVLSPGMSSGGPQAWSFDDTQWLLKASSVNVMLAAGFAGRARLWRGDDAAPAFSAVQPSYLVDALPQGNTTIHLQVEDRCGQEGPVQTRVLTFDTRAPEVRAVLNGGRVFSSDATMLLTVDALEDHSFPLFMRRAVCEGSGPSATCQPADLETAAWVPLAVADEVTFANTEGPKSVHVHVRDSSFNIWRSGELTVQLDRSAPTDVMVLLDGNPAPTTVYVQRPWMTVNASNAVEMRWTLGTTFANATEGWERFQSGVSRQIDLGIESGTVTLLVHLRDAGFNVIEVPPLTIPVSNLAGLQGRVLLPGLASNAGARVSVLGTNKQAFTTAAGTFTIPDITSGEYVVDVSADGYRSEKLTVVLRAPQVTDLGDVTLTPSGGYISGVVVLQGRQNHSGATVALHRAGLPDKVVTTAAGGSFRIPVSEGIYNDGLTIQHPLHLEANHNQPMVVLTDAEFSVGAFNLLAFANDLQGTVWADNRTDHSGIVVTLQCQQACVPGTTLSAVSNSAGTWTVPAVPLGQYLITMQHPAIPQLEAFQRGGVVVLPGETQAFPLVTLRERYVHVNGFVSINGEAVYVTDPTGSVTLNTSTGCERMEISNDVNFMSSEIRPCAPVNTWQLESSVDGDKVVCVRFYAAGSNIPSTATCANVKLDRAAVLSAFSHDAPAAGAALGSVVTFTVDGEPNAVVAVNIAGYAQGIELRDDGRPPDLAADDGRYVRRVTIDLARDLVAAATEALMVDAAGNLATLPGPPLTVVIPPAITNVLLGVDTIAQTVTVEWQTDESTTGTVRWWREVQSPFTPVVSGATGLSHSVTLDASSLTPGDVYSFVIEAVDTSGNVTTSQVRTFTFAPTTPLFVAAIPGDGVAWVRWEGPSQRGVQGFHVYRATAAAGPFTKLTAAPFRNELLMYQDDTVTNGVRYFYRVTTVDTSNNESVASAVHDATPGPNTGPTVVTEQTEFDQVTVWSSRGSPYTLADSVSVEAGKLLVVGPGTTVLVAEPDPMFGPRYIRVEGRVAVLGARGVINGMSESDDGLVVFQSAKATPMPGDWAGFRIYQTSAPGELDMARSLGRYDSGNIFHRARILHGGATDNLQGAHVLQVQQGYPANGNPSDWRSALYVSRVEIAEATNYAVATLNCRDVVLKDVVLRDVASAISFTGSRSVLVQDATILGAGGLGNISMDGNPDAYGLVTNLTVQGYGGGLNLGSNVHMVDSVIAGGAINQTAVGAHDGEDRQRPSVARSTLENGHLAMNGGVASALQVRNMTYGPANADVFGSDFLDMGCNPLAIDCTGVAGLDSYFYRELLANTFSGGGSNIKRALVTTYTIQPGLEVAYNHFLAPLLDFPALLIESDWFAATRYHSNSFLMAVTPGTILARSRVAYVAGQSIDVRGNHWDPATNAAMQADTRTDMDVLDDLWDSPNFQELIYAPSVNGAFPMPRIQQPYWGQRFYVGDTITFEGSATDPEDGNVPPASLHWYLNGTTPRGAGSTLTISDLPAGLSGTTAVPAGYRMVLVVTDQDGQEARLPVHFQVWPAP